MPRQPEINATARDLRAAKLRAALTRLVTRKGMHRGHVIRRITHAVGRLVQPSKLRTAPRRLVLINMPSVTFDTSQLGLGLGGGGGGSPGLTLRIQDQLA